MKKRTIAAALAAVAIAVTIPFAYAQMGGYGPGMMGGHGQGQGGYGPGMMGGYGMGSGMMGGNGGGYGMGPGMMGGYGGGYGMGSGMMGGYGGGYGMGPGMMGAYGPDLADALNLSDEQREKITKIQEGVSTKYWELMGKMQEQQFKLRELSASGNADDAAIGKAYKNIESLRQQMRTATLDARKQVDASLTKSQREQLQRGWGRDAK
ncbi:MAG: Spy/CpxP family protein refolding chaperone [Rhodocyclaceae bacterium]|nr:Spy/CpxP family protein refolding chaperone [Rhodocyclaceae bacterium]